MASRFPLMSNASCLLRRVEPPSRSSTLRRARRLVDVLVDAVRARRSNPSWEQTLDRLASQAEEEDDGDQNSQAVAAAAPLVISWLHDADSALAFFGWLRRQTGIRSSSSSSSSPARPYAALLKVLARSRRFSDLELVLEIMAEEGFKPSLESLSAIVAGYADAGEVEKALRFYAMAKEAQEELPQTDACNRVLRLLVRRGLYEDARKMYDEMLQREGKADNFSTGIMVEGLCDQGRVDEAVEVIERRWGHGCIPNVIFYNELIHGCFKNGDVQKARAFFREMQSNGFLPTLISYGRCSLAYARMTWSQRSDR